MRACSVVMMAITFVFGIGIVSLVFVLGKMFVDMAQNAYQKHHELLLVLAENQRE